MYRSNITKVLGVLNLRLNNSASKLFHVQSNHNRLCCSGKGQNSFLNYSLILLKKHSQFHNLDWNEEFTALAKTYKEQGCVSAEHVRNVLEQGNIDLFSSEQCLLLLQCSGQAIVDDSRSERSVLCDKVWDLLEESNVPLKLEHYNKYLEISLENQVNLDYLNFLSKMKNCQPDEKTFHLLLECVCQLGDIKQAMSIISEMKTRDFPADEKVFNFLILGNAIKGGLSDAKTVLNAMQIARIQPSSLTYCHLLRGLAQKNDNAEFMEALRIFPCEINDNEFLKLLLALGVHGNHLWIDKVMTKADSSSLMNESSQQLNLLCIHLVHIGQAEAAFYYYKILAFSESTKDKMAHALHLLGEMLNTGMCTKRVIGFLKELGDVDYEYKIQSLTEIALKKGLTEAALDLFREMPKLRAHYFWPILLKAASEQRETGVFNIITKMFEFGVKPDIDTLEFYVMPYCDMNDPKTLIIRLKHLGFSYKELFTPILSHLLWNKQLTAVQNLCSISDNLIIIPEKLIQPLGKAWITTKDSNIVVLLLKRMQNLKPKTDIIGKFFLQLFKACKTPDDYNQFLELLKVVHQHNIRISNALGDSILYRIKTFEQKIPLAMPIQKSIEMLIDNGLHPICTSIPHPSNMTENELENHLIELEHKDMETRGTLRRLIQLHCRLGNETRVNELRQQFINAGYKETTGMKAMIFQTYVSKGDDVNALNMYTEIKQKYPEFKLDDFKIIDFANILVQNNKYESAIKLLEENRAIQGGPGIVRNCWRLLSMPSDEHQVEQLYKLLIKKRYCTPSNIILGPLIKIHLKSNNLKRAVQVYAECAAKYKCTPLQVELVCAIVNSENEDLLQEVLSITAKVHGPETTGIGLISALAQAGLEKSLTKFLLERSRISQEDITKLCDRLLQCKDVIALETLAKAICELPRDQLDQSIVYNYVMKVHGINNDCESAVKFYRHLLDLKINVSAALTQELLRMVHRCNYTVSEDLLKGQVMS